MRGFDAALRTAALALIGFVLLLPAQYAGSNACRPCHDERVELQSKTGHARALAKAPAGAPGEWSFGAGAKAITWVSQSDPDTYVEHGVSYFAATKSTGLTPGHDTPVDVRYPTFDAEATTLRCFRCHSTGPLSLAANRSIQPAEPGIHCEACHGPGAEHVAAAGRTGSIFNPKRLSAVELNDFCGACHRNGETDWTDKWKTRHQPSYLARSACFRNSNGALSCLTCHDPHSPLNQKAAEYDQRCTACHKAVRHVSFVPAGKTCVGCHMPQVPVTPQLRFTNHWIGVYTSGAANLVPSRSTVKALQPVPVSGGKPFTPADPGALMPLFEQAVTDEVNESGADSQKTASITAELGKFLASIGDPGGAEIAFRKTLKIDEMNGAPAFSADAESLAEILAESGRSEEAAALFRRAASGSDSGVAARSLANLASLDPEHAAEYYRDAVKAERRSEGKESKRVAILLNNLAMAVEQNKDYRGAAALLREALVIQQKLAGPDSTAAASTMSNLGSVLETMGQHDEAERMERGAVRIFELKLGPASAELATGYTNLADILWTKGERTAAASLYVRAISIDESVYGPGNPEVAGDLVNYGTLLRESGQPAAAEKLLRRALAIYENAGDAGRTQAFQVRAMLAKQAVGN